jgi:hypothetical protein
MHLAARFHSMFRVPLALAIAAHSVAFAATPEHLEFFENKVRPLLADHCYPCHSAQTEKPKAGLRLDTRAGWEKGGASGPALLPGKPADSLLLQTVRGTAKDIDPMPPEGDGRRTLTAEEIATLEQWIQLGAPDPRDDVVAGNLPDPARHWAFQRPVDPDRPTVRKRAWPRSDLDYHVLARLEEAGLAPMPEADPRTLLRRITHDLTGLPPTPEEMQAFLNDTAPDAYGRAVDRLLASPRYGERWGRWWLDVARYADSKGYVFEEERRYAYAYTYRDWVVNALNRDLSYDRFLMEQIAGDRLATAEDPWPMAALGFLTLGRRFLNNQADIIDDRIDVVFRGTQGLTVGCARCHDHKSDPIPTADYYSIYGVFASSEEPGDKPLLGPNPNPHAAAEYVAERSRREKELNDYRESSNAAVIRKLREKVGDYLLCAQEGMEMDGSQLEGAARTRSLDPGLVGIWKGRLQNWRKSHHPIFTPWLELAALGTNDFTAASKTLLEGWADSSDPEKPLNPVILEGLRSEPLTAFSDVAQRYARVLLAADAAWNDAVSEAKKNETPEPTALADATQESLRLILHGDDSPIREATRDINRFYDVPVAQKNRALKRKLDELDATHPGAPLRAMALVDKTNPVEPVIFKRGNAGNPGPRVPRQFLGILDGADRKPFTDGSGRLELARAIASPDNPLTARVLVNRVWARHLGSPLVKTPADFGIRTDPPINPGLLDHLAVRFMESGWSLKALHREILLSATYRQASDPGSSPRHAETYARNSRIDPANDHFWRMNRKRFDFEALRDSLLFVAGGLDQTIGGQPVEMFEEKTTPRRTLYGYIDRQNLPGLLRSFDFASPDTTSAMRFQTTVPQQALFMMNNPFMVELARRIATRPDLQQLPDDNARLQRIHQLLFQRPATPDEQRLAQSFLKAQPDLPPLVKPSEAWSYGVGQFDPDTDRIRDFKPFPHFRNNQWQMTPEYPSTGGPGHAALSANGGHPGNDHSHSVVRRWTPRHPVAVRLSGELHHPAKAGDGVRARVVSSRQGTLGQWTALSGRTSTDLDRIEIQAGEWLDLVVEMLDSDNSDSFNWAPVLTPVDAAAGSASSVATVVWDAKKDFKGPASVVNPLDAWGKYAQVLLSANEFLFVD